MSSDDVEIIGDSREIIEISDDNAEEDKKDVIILNYVEEDTAADNDSNICIVIKDEQEQIAQCDSKNNNLNHQITEVINLDSNFNKSDKKNANSNVKRRRINSKLRNRNRSNKTNTNNVRGIQEQGKTLKASKTVVDNSNNMLNSGMQQQVSDDCNNNESINNIHSNNKESTTTTSLDSTAANTQKRYNNYDFSKLKWLRPLKNISSPPHFQIVIIDRGHPNWRITNDKWLMIEKRLLEALNYEMLQSNDSTIGLFDGAKWTRGIKIVGCHNKNAVDFITKFIFNLDKLWYGAKLDVFPITHICRHIVKVYIPPPTLETQVILSLIKLQNGSLCCEDWEVVREHERGNGGGVDIWFSINDESFTDLCRLRGEVKYGINRIFFKPSH